MIEPHLRLFWLSVIVILVACQGGKTPIPAVADNSIITGQPCAPSCWQGLTPGQTNFSEVDAFLHDSPLVNGNLGDQFTAVPGTGFSQSWWWAGEDKISERKNGLEVDSDNILKFIYLHPNTDVTIGDIFKTYGAPTLMTMAVRAPRDIFEIGGLTGISMSALYIDQSFEVRWFEEIKIGARPINFCLSLNPLIFEIIYYSPELASAEENTLQPTRTFPGGVIIEGNNVVQTVNNQVTVSCVQIP